MTEQPAPVTTEASRDVFAALIDDLRARNAVGMETYGKPLETFNGRDALQDLYEEQLDALVYTKQAMMERDALVAENARLRYALRQAIDTLADMHSEDGCCAFDGGHGCQSCWLQGEIHVALGDGVAQS